MASDTSKAIHKVAEKLRAIAEESEENALIGSEEQLIALLGSSKSTVRQVARLLEREGLLRVRRGPNGGYFAARPDAGHVEASVSYYLEKMHVTPKDVTSLASVLWVEVMKRAADADRSLVDNVVENLRKVFDALGDDATFEQVFDAELLSRAEIFRLSDSAYIKLIFDINAAFSRRRFAPPLQETLTNQVEFVRAWRSAKLMEVDALAERDPTLAALAGQFSRSLWQRRLEKRFGAQG